MSDAFGATPVSTVGLTIAIDGVSQRYRRTRALRGMTAQLGPGIVGLLGPNGAGKSTLIRILATLAAPQHGVVSYTDVAGSHVPTREVRAALGYLPQDFAPYLNFRALDFVIYLAALKGLPHPQRRISAEAALDAVGLADRAGDRIRTLSGGSRQRVGIAQAIVGDPAMLILDEPTAGLDPKERIRFRRLLAGGPGQRTVLLSTHLVEDVRELCDSIVVLDGGVIKFHGSPKALREAARGWVWRDSHPHPDALDVRKSADDGYLWVGPGTPTATAAEPTMEDGYLVVTAGGAQR